MKATHTRKRALITGSSGGIGSAVAKDLSAKGYHIILVDINQESNEKLATQLQSAEVVTLDLTDRNALSAFCQHISAYNPAIAFINAGMIHPGDVTDISEKMVDLQLEINLRSAIILNRSCGEHMKSKGEGSIVNTVSAGGIVGLKSSAVYSAAKFGLRGFLMGFHSEMKPYGVSVSGLYPAAVDTQMLREEATHGGSVLNFLSSPSSVDDLVKGFNEAIDTGRLEVHIPFIDSISTRILGGVLPGMIHKLYPALERKGMQGRTKYLQKIEHTAFAQSQG